MLYALRRVNAIPDDWIRIDPPFAANAPCNASTPPETSPTAVSNKRPTTSDSFRQNAVQAVNTHLTVRNWLIGFYIVEFEQNGEDRAKYGAKLLQNLADGFNEDGLSYRNLNLYRKFYNAYPQVSAYVPEFLQRQFGGIMQTVSAQLQLSENQGDTIMQTPSAELKRPHEMPKSVPVEKLLGRLSFSHITLLLPIEDPLKRLFYEIECIKGTWSVRELKRQINSLYYERSGMSRNPALLSEITQTNIEPGNMLELPTQEQLIRFVNEEVAKL